MACSHFCFTFVYRQFRKSSLFYSRWPSADIIIVFVVINYMELDFRKFLLFSIIYSRCVNMRRVIFFKSFENGRTIVSHAEESAIHFFGLGITLL